MPRLIPRCSRIAHYLSATTERRASVPIPDDMVIAQTITTADGVTLMLVNVFDRDDEIDYGAAKGMAAVDARQARTRADGARRFGRVA